MGPLSRLIRSVFGKKMTGTKKEIKPEAKQEHKTVVPSKVKVTTEPAKKVSDPYGFGAAADDIVGSGVDIATVSVASVYEVSSPSDDISSCSVDTGPSSSPSCD